MASVKDAWIKKYGVDEGLRKWNVLRPKFNSNGTPPAGKNCVKYWTDLGYSDAEAIKEVSRVQRARSPRCVEYYNTRGIFDEHMIAEKISEFQRRQCPRCIEYYIHRGIDIETGKQLIYKIQSERSIKSSRFNGKRHSALSKSKMATATSILKRQEIELLGKEEWLKRNFGDKSKNRGSCISKVERTLHTYVLDICSIDFDITLNKQIPGTTYIPDITIGKKIIEFNGDRWHANPKIYSADMILNKPGEQSVSKLWERDLIRESALKSLGYSILIVWEYDWKHSRAECEMKIRKFIYDIEDTGSKGND